MAACFARFGITLPRRLDPGTLGRQCNYALPYALGVIALTCAEGVHLYVVAFSFPLAVFAIYSVGVLQIPLTDLAFHSLADVALVHLTGLAQKHRFRDIQARISRTAGQLVTLLIPFYVWLALNADGLILTLYTDRFAASVPIFQISLLTIPLTAVAVDYVPRAFADTPFLLVVNTFRLFLALALVIPLVAILGPLGAAIGTVAALALTRAVIMVRVSRLTRTTLSSLLPWGHLLRVGILSTVLGLLTIALTHAVSAATTVRVVVGTPIFVLGYLAISWHLGILKQEDKEWLRTSFSPSAAGPYRDA